MTIRKTLTPAQPGVEDSGRALPPINLNRFDLVSLRLFVAVVDAGSLTAGAERFRISLAAASKRIAELEGHVGAPLLQRGTRGVAPTPAGLTLQQHAVELVARLEQLAMAMGDFHAGARGHLRLWANSSACNGLLPDVLAEYCAAYPGIKIDLEEANSDEAVRAIRSGAAELGVIGEHTPCEGLEFFPCQRDELVLLTSASHPLAGRDPVTLVEALGCDFVALPRTTSLMRQISAAAERTGLPLKIRLQLRSFDAMCRMVAAGLGVCILPRASARPHVVSMGLHVARLEGTESRRQLLLAMRSRAALSPPARALAELLLRQA